MGVPMIVAELPSTSRGLISVTIVQGDSVVRVTAIEDCDDALYES